MYDTDSLNFIQNNIQAGNREMIQLGVAKNLDNLVRSYEGDLIQGSKYSKFTKYQHIRITENAVYRRCTDFSYCRQLNQKGHLFSKHMKYFCLKNLGCWQEVAISGRRI